MDQEDFCKLALSETDAVYRLAYHLAHQPQEADDLVQETYLRAFKSAAGFQLTEHGIRPWLFKILHNVVHSRYAKEQRQHHLIEELQARAPAEVARDRPLADLSLLDWDGIDERLKRAVDDLPLPHRIAFLLCAVEGLRYREIAEITGVPEGTVMSRLYRARTLLSERLSDLAAERGIKGGTGLRRIDPAPRDEAPR